MTDKVSPEPNLITFKDCDSEKIQFLGSVQPYGALMQLSLDWLVTRASDNLVDFLGIPHRSLVGASGERFLPPDVVHHIRGQLHAINQGFYRRANIYSVEMTPDGPKFDLCVYRSIESILIEFERSEDRDTQVLQTVQPLIDALHQLDSVELMVRTVARHIRALSAFDRVMVYRFLPDQSGEVIAEAKSSSLEPFLGLRYPASDIPPQARALYARNTIRLIADVDGECVAVNPRLDPLGQPLDLSDSSLRAVSPIHLEYLRNMGVKSSLSISLMVDGKLWGLIAAHSTHSRYLSLRLRSALDFYGRITSTLLESKLRLEEVRRHRGVRLLHVGAMNQFGSFVGTAENFVNLLEGVDIGIRYDGCVAYIDGELATSGTAPDLAFIEILIAFLNRAAAGKVYATHHLASLLPEAISHVAIASGILAIPISRKPRDYLIIFRKELVHDIRWGGEPVKVLRQDGMVQSYGPRESFAAWKQTVRNESERWTEDDLMLAEGMRISMLELLLRTTDESEKFRKQSQDKQDTLIAELNHRVRNILNLIVGLVRQTRDTASDVEEFTKEVLDRVLALGRAHDQITQNGWGAKSAQEMIKTEASAYLGAKSERVYITGPDVALEPTAFSTMALVVHEMVTNSAKYGAFKDSHGAVYVDLERNSEENLIFRWREECSSPIGIPKRRGFGSTLIERAIPHELGGRVELDFKPTGLHALFEIPASSIGSLSTFGDNTVGYAAPLTELEDKLDGCVLLLEDNLLIALETEQSLVELGASDVALASNVASAFKLIDIKKPDFALLDFNLGRENSVAVATKLRELGVPFVFASGYGETNIISSQFPDVQVLTKPYGAQGIMKTYSLARSARAII